MAGASSNSRGSAKGKAPAEQAPVIPAVPATPPPADLPGDAVTESASPPSAEKPVEVRLAQTGGQIAEALVSDEGAAIVLIAPDDAVALEAALRAIGGVVVFADRAIPLAASDAGALAAGLRSLGAVVICDGDRVDVDDAVSLLPRIDWQDLNDELVRRSGSGELNTADLPPTEAPGYASLEQETRTPRRHRLAMHYDRDGIGYQPGQRLRVTYDEFVELRALSVFEGKWEDGDVV